MEMPDIIYAERNIHRYYDAFDEQPSHVKLDTYHHSRIVEALKAKLSETVIHLAARNSEIAELQATNKGLQTDLDDGREYIEELQAKLYEAKDALLDVEQKTNITALALVNGLKAGTIFLSDKLFSIRQRARTTLEEIE